MRLQIKKITLSEIAMPLKSAFETSFGVTTTRRVIIIRAYDKSGAIGYGECTAMDQPFYNHETVDAAWGIIAKLICPMLRSANLGGSSEIAEILKPIHGNRMAVGAVETAVWDLESKLLGKPLWLHLGGARNEIDCGVSIGLQKSPEVLVEKVANEIASGYKRIKLKIKPGQDVKFVRAVRREYPSIMLSVDANSAYHLASDLETMKALDEFDLLMIEQPLAAGDLLDHAKLQAQLTTPICLDESITCLRDARQAVELGSCRIINIKLGRVGGHASARSIEAFAKSKGIPVWCGGMLESGIGRAHNIALSTHSGFTLPGDISSSSRYWDRDIVSPEIEVSSQGTIQVSAAPGIGYEVDDESIDRLSARSETVIF